MRIASNQYHDTMSTALQGANAGVSKQMQQMASGNRVLRPSDDTIATVRLARLAQERSALDQYHENIGALTTRLQTNEVVLGSMKDDLMSARDLLVWAADGSNSPEDVAAMAHSLESLRDSLYFATNTRNAEGRYMFSGTASEVATLSVDEALPAGQRYATGSGINSQQQEVAVADGVSVAANITLADADIGGFLNALDQAIEQFKSGRYDKQTARAQMDHLDGVLNRLSAEISLLGGRQKVIQTMDDSQAQINLAGKQASLALGALDYADAAVQLNSYTLAVQATQKAYAKVSGLSLFDVF